MKKSHILILTIILVLIADQALKFYIKLNFEYGESVPVIGNWFYLHFIENKGMAFGIDLGGKVGKLALSLFRIAAVVLLFIYIRRLLKEKAPIGLLLAFSLIFAGAVGNIIDSAVYGLIFSESNYHGGLAQLMPADGGYAPFLFGKVVDMFYFPLIDTILPEWVPIWGGKPFRFFEPVFNIADASISIGVVLLFFTYNKFFKAEETSE